MREVRRLVQLAWPVVLGQVGMVGMGVVDLLMIGPLGGEATAAVGLGNTWSFGVVIVALGAAQGVDPLVTQAYGAGDSRRAGLAAARGLVLMGLLLIPVVALHLLAEPGMRALGQPPSAIPDAATYCWIMALGMPPFLAFGVLRQLLQGGGVMRPAMWVIGLANLVNVVGNALLIDPLGVAGVAASTTIVRWVMFGALVWIGLPQIRAAWPRDGGGILDRAALARLAGIALPVGLQTGLEVWAFNAASILAGWLGAAALAAHVAALNAISVAFMIANGVGAASATRVGNQVGADQPWIPSAGAALGIGVIVMSCTGALFLGAPSLVAHAYNADASVIGLVVAILPIGGLFGLFDGLQVIAFGILRGLGDTRTPSWFNLVGYWLVGLPLAYVLAWPAGLGLVGVWAGLGVALGIVAGLLLVRIVWHAQASTPVQPSRGARPVH